MNGQMNSDVDDTVTAAEGSSHDYSRVDSTARVAVYDDLRSAPRILDIGPAPTVDFIESLASTVYEQSHGSGGHIPYTVIREVTENFIHARFNEIVVSVLDGGNTIRFADQGPGIHDKDKAQLPGFTSATEPMKRYIRGVGSGLPIVREYLELTHGFITIEDNLGTGAVVTVSLVQRPEGPRASEQQPAATPSLTPREHDFLLLFLHEGALGVTDLSRLTEVPVSSTYMVLQKLEQAGLVEKTAGQKRILTTTGAQVASTLGN